MKNIKSLTKEELNILLNIDNILLQCDLHQFINDANKTELFDYIVISIHHNIYLKYFYFFIHLQIRKNGVVDKISSEKIHIEHLMDKYDLGGDENEYIQYPINLDKFKVMFIN